MFRAVPPPRDQHVARWWRRDDDGQFCCDLCPRRCILAPGQRGFCYVREATETGIVLSAYGRSSGFCIDPIEKKPLFHFFPGTPVLSFGTAGCNLGCRYCQNWDSIKAREVDLLGEPAPPEAIADAARRLACTSVAFTYNDPVIFAEYAIDTARACRAEGVKSVAVTSGYIAAEARGEFFAAMDAASIDLKAFSEDFYRKQCDGHLQPVLESIEHAVKETRCWVELTTLLIPGLNDSTAGVEALAEWILDCLGPDVPLHFTAFHPDYNLLHVPATPAETLRAARRVAKQVGLRHVYAGRDNGARTTLCAGCGAPLIERHGHEITRYSLDAGYCPACKRELPGQFGNAPGRWGGRRLPVSIVDRPCCGEHETG